MPLPEHLELNCTKCHTAFTFSMQQLHIAHTLCCPECGHTFSLKDDGLLRQLEKFEALCQQLVDSEEILGETAVGVTIGNREALVPFKLLLTRLNTQIKLTVDDDQQVVVRFLHEPLQTAH